MRENFGFFLPASLSLSGGAMKVIFMLIAYDATAALLFPFVHSEPN